MVGIGTARGWSAALAITTGLWLAALVNGFDFIVFGAMYVLMRYGGIVRFGYRGA